MFLTGGVQNLMLNAPVEGRKASIMVHRECEQIDISNLAVTDYLSPVL